MESNRPPNPSPDPEVGPPPWAQLPPGIEAGPPDGTDGEGDHSPVPVYDRVETRTNVRAVLLAAVLALVVGAVGGFFVGRMSAKKGPTTLAQAIQMAASGQLPRGNVGAGGAGRGLFGGGAGGPNGTGQANGQNGQGGGNGGRGGFQGNITAVDGNTLTVQTAAGAIKVVIAGNTSILKTASGSRSDLTVGKAVQIRLDVNASNGGGNGNTAGAVTASSIVAEPTQ